MFESDGKKWYESGGTRDVTISDNVFENCLYGSSDNWGSAVIDMKPRERFDGEHYYHSSIKICKNKFIGNTKPLLSADNSEMVVFNENDIKDQTAECVLYRNCKKFSCNGNTVDEKIKNLI